MSKGLNIFHLAVVGPLFFMLGYTNLKGVNQKVVKFMRSDIVTGILMLFGLAVIITHTVLLVKKINFRRGFMIGDGRRLMADQYDNSKLMGTQGRLQESREMLAHPGHPFEGVETHAVEKHNEGQEVVVEEGFIAENLPLWTEK